MGRATIAPAAVKFDKTGFNFTTTTAILTAAKNRLTVVTSAGEDSAQ